MKCFKVSLEVNSVEKRYIVTGEYGLHARPATRLVNLAVTFSSDIFIKSDEKIVNLKSVMGVMSLGIYKGQIITIAAQGDDEADAIKAISSFISIEKIGNLINE